MIYYENLESASLANIILHASNDAEHWNEEERRSLKIIGEALENWNRIAEEEEELVYSCGFEGPSQEELEPIRKKQAKIESKISRWNLQGNQGAGIQENGKPFGFRVVGYNTHDGYSTPGIGRFE